MSDQTTGRHPEVSESESIWRMEQEVLNALVAFEEREKAMRSACQQGRQRCENYLASLSRHLPAVSVNHVWYMLQALQQDFDAALAGGEKMTDRPRTRGQEVAEKWYLNDYNQQKNTVGEAIQLLAAAIDAERRAVKEECAMVAEGASGCHEIAAAIRALP